MLYTNIEEALKEAREMRREGAYTVVNSEAKVAYLSRRDVEYEDATGQDSFVRRNLEKKGFDVRPYWEQVF